MDLDAIRDRCSLSESGCWVWRGATASGYPRAKVNRKLVSVHRLAYELANPGSETKGKDVCHKCDNPGAVTPSIYLRELGATICRTAKKKGG